MAGLMTVTKTLLGAGVILLLCTASCGSGQGSPDGGGGGPDAVVIGDPIDGVATVMVGWPSGDPVSITLLHMEAKVPCKTAPPGMTEPPSCDVVITATDGQSTFSLDIPSVDAANGRTLSLNDPSLLRIQVTRSDGMQAANAAGAPTVGSLVISQLAISPVLSLQAQFSEDSHLTGGSRQDGLVDVTLSGSLMASGTAPAN
jgi:hypothetical protein